MDIIVTILLLIVITVLVIGVCAIKRLTDITMIDYESYPENYFRILTEQMAKEYAATFDACKRLESLLESGELDLEKIREGTESEAYALMVSTAKHAIDAHAAKLVDVNERTEKSQKQLNYCLEKGNSTLIPDAKKRMSEFAKQREICEKDLEKANRRLQRLLHPEESASLKDELQVPKCFEK